MGTGTSGDGELRAALVEGSPDVVVVIDAGTTVRYANDAALVHTGWPLDQLIGHTVVDLLHPEDVERAVFDMQVYTAGSAEPGYSSYRVRHADGSYRRFDVSAADFELEGERVLALYCRPDDSAAPSVLDGLLRGTSIDETMRAVCETFNWRLHGSQVAISWRDHDGFHFVSTGLPEALAGVDFDGDTPWGRCWRGATPQRSVDLLPLDNARRAAADELGLGTYWIEPVLDDVSNVCALVTLWMRAGGPVPEIHSLGMSVAKDYTELIMRWTRQRLHLQDAALRDTLTGLANRKAFYDALATNLGAGAVLYCDLDRFKPVNDDLGHVAGDELLRAVAGRITACVRSGDVVARLGGDEFGVLCVGLTHDRAVDLAERIRVAVDEPFRIAGTIAKIGISIGVAHSSDDLGELVLERADRALYRAKAGGGSVVVGPED